MTDSYTNKELDFNKLDSPTVEVGESLYTEQSVIYLLCLRLR